MDRLSVVRTPGDLKRQLQTWRRQSLRIGFVPTMGYLHQGHLSLVEKVRKHADRVVASIFVNPTQFAPGEDLEQYPRDAAGDRSKLEQAGAHLLFMPDTQVMYPGGAQTFVEVKQVAQPLCGQYRPIHFQGVATVVTKLFNLVQPDVAVFGEKDYQQLVVIRQLVHDLLMDVEVLGGSTVREPDGLAMSSRNAYLTPKQRDAAVCLSRALRQVRQLFAEGEHEAKSLLEAAAAVIHKYPEARAQYIELRDPRKLRNVQGAADPDDRMFLAVFLGETRLIDNAPLATPCGL